jgi:hypothetical protein
VRIMITAARGGPTERAPFEQSIVTGLESDRTPGSSSTSASVQPSGEQVPVIVAMCESTTSPSTPGRARARRPSIDPRSRPGTRRPAHRRRAGHRRQLRRAERGPLVASTRGPASRSVHERWRRRRSKSAISWSSNGGAAGPPPIQHPRASRCPSRRESVNLKVPASPSRRSGG